MFYPQHIICSINLVYLPFGFKIILRMVTRIIFLILILVISGAAFGQKYKRIHNKAILVDTHNDFPSASIEKKVSFDDNLLGKTHSDLTRMKAGGVDVQIFSIFCGPEQQQPYAFA